MSEDKVYKDGDIVWVKLGNNWWPGEVAGPTRHPEGLIKHLKRIPYCVVKFFNENTYEYVRSGKQIFPFQCPKQDDFIRKGYSLFNSHNSFMEKFPADVEVAKQLIRRKESSFIINDRPDSIVKAILGQPLIRKYNESCEGSEHREKRHSGDSVTKILNITPNRNNDSFTRQQSKAQTCDFCDFTSVRLNVMILHRKIHSNKNHSGASNSTNNTTAKSIIAKSTTGVATAPITNTNADRSNRKQTNQTLGDGVNSKTKASTILRTKAATASAPPRIAPANNDPNPLNSSSESAETTPSKEKNNGKIKFTTSKHKSKAAKKSTVEEKDIDAYASILSDFCPSETESTPPPEEKQSRRSLRHCKIVNEIASEKETTIYIDLSESKTIQKIPKKREYSTLQKESESGCTPINASIEISEPDVVCLSDKQQESSAPIHSGSSKKDAEDIRRMLLADWSDDDETAVDTIYMDDNCELEIQGDKRLTPVKELQISVEVVTSTPAIKSSSATTGRIRNIPKKDRRDVVLQDFNSDLSFVQNDDTEIVASKTMADDLDSSNSSVVEVIEEQQSAAIITLNDDEDPENSQIEKNQTDIVVTDGKENDDSSILLANDKFASAATSICTLSCFDFQDDEDEQDNSTTTISHFKKKYISGEKLQNSGTTTDDELKENNVANDRAELAEKDQRLVADIESLLEQSQPTVVDLLNASSFEECLSVKDLPIKERGKRIFKSRNKTRLTGKVHPEHLPTAEVNLPAEAETIEENSNVTEMAESPTKDYNQTDTEQILASEQNVLIKNNYLVEISDQQIVLSTAADDIPTFLEDKQSTPNNEQSNDDPNKEYNDCSEISSVDRNTYQKKQIINENVITTFNDTNKIANVEEQIEDSTETQNKNNDGNDNSSQQLLDVQQTLVNHQQETENYPEQDNCATVNETQMTKTQEIILSENVEETSETFPYEDKLIETVSHLDDNNTQEAFDGHPCKLNNVEVKDKPAEKVKVLEVKIFKHSGQVFENDLHEEFAEEIFAEKSLCEEISINLDNGTSDNTKTDNERKCETVFKIRVKSPEQLLEQAFVIAAQQDQDQVGVDARLISTTPTDENSSMGASDTGAEFGSPTSMLSEERLPAFRFQSNQTPQLEVEATEMMAGVLNKDSCKNSTTVIIKDAAPNDKFQLKPIRDQKSLHSRRFSMDLVSLQTEPKSSIKHQRLSVDDFTTSQDNCFENPQEILLTSEQKKIEINIRPKSRHMKITPRRNVSELFKEQKCKHIKICSSLEKVKKTQSDDDDVVKGMENEQLISSGDVSLATGKCNKVNLEKLNETTEPTEQTKEKSEKTSKNNVRSKIIENKDEESPTVHEALTNITEEIPNETLTNKFSLEVETIDKEESKAAEPSVVACFTKDTITDLINHEEAVISMGKNQDINFTSNLTESPVLNKITNETIDMTNICILDANIDQESNHTNNFEDKSVAIPVTTNEKTKDNIENSESTPIEKVLLENINQMGQVLVTPFSPEIPPSTPQEREVVIESEISNQMLEIRQETPSNIEQLPDIANYPLMLKEKETSPEKLNQIDTTQGKATLTNEIDEQENQLTKEEIACCPLTPLEKESTIDSSDLIATPSKAKQIDECETLVEPVTPQPLDMVIEFDSLSMPNTPRESNIHNECENIMHIPSTPQAKDLIIECEPSTPQDIVECDYNFPVQITPEKEVTIESEISPDLPAQITPEKEVTIESDIIPDKSEGTITEESMRLDDREALLEKEFQVIEPKESYVPIGIPQEPQTHSLQTDADKAAEEFLIEFDSIVNHSHAVEEDVQNSTIEDAMNADDLINNIIEEVHEDAQPKEIVQLKNELPIQFEPLKTYTVVSNKNWNQIYKDSFKTRQSINPAKRRQTICFEISDTKEGVACKKQAFDFESILPVNKTIKRTAERKLTLPAIETKFSNSKQSHNIFALNHNQIALNKKLIPTAKRKLSIEDNITPFIIQRPKQTQPSSNAVSGPPPLQRIRPLRRQSHIISKTNLDSMSEPPPPLQSNDNLFNDLFPMESSSSKQGIDSDQKPEGGRVLSQQIISGPTSAASAVHQNKTVDPKISNNKQIGVDSRGNKYVIIKTPPTDIVVQPTLTSSPAGTVSATNNFGTTITFQPLARCSSSSSSEISPTKPITRNKNISKQQLQQQQMKQISITVPASSTTELANSSENSSAKTALRNKRKAAQAKTIAAATAAANTNSAKHRQTIEALSRRLSIASEAPPLAKISRTSSTNVQTQISNNNNSSLSTLFGDAQVSNIAQQQLIQLQQQQQQQQSIQPTSSSLPPPIILNKSAHQQSVIQRKGRKFPSQQQTQLQQQTTPAKSSQLVQQQQNSLLHQSQQLQQQIITQIALQQQTQQHTPLQPPPLQQIQQQTVPLQQQIVQHSDGVIITTAATEDDDVFVLNTQLVALPTQPYPGYAETFLLCKVNTCKPVDNVPRYLNQLNELVPVPLEAIESGQKIQKHQSEIKPTSTPHQLLVSQTNDPQDNAGNLQISGLNCSLVDDDISAGIESEHQSNQPHQLMEESVVDENVAAGSNNQISGFGDNEELNTDLVSNNGILLNIEGQQVLLDAATFAHLLAHPDANTQLISDDGTEYVLTHEVLQALQIQQEQQQALELANAAAEQQQQQQLEQTAASNDIIAVALAGSDLYDNDVLAIDTSQGMQILDGNGTIVFPTPTGSIIHQQHLTPPAVVTNAVLDQSPIMSTLEVPSVLTAAHKLQGNQLITVPSHHLATSSDAALGLGGRTNLEDSLAAIGVTTQSSSIPSSLGLPITVTNPNIASKVTSAGPLNEMLQFVSHRPTTAAATAAAVAAAALAGESRIFSD